MQIKPCDGVLVFTIPEDIAIQRLVQRGESSGRVDDNEETIRKRMEVRWQREDQHVDIGFYQEHVLACLHLTFLFPDAGVPGGEPASD